MYTNKDNFNIDENYLNLIDENDLNLIEEILGDIEDFDKIDYEPDIEIDSLENSIMAKIEYVKPTYLSDKAQLNKIFYIISFLFTGLVILTLLVNLDKNLIIENMDKVPFLYTFLEFSEYVKNMFTSFSSFFNGVNLILKLNLPILLESIKYSGAVAIICLIIASYVSRKRTF